LVIWANHLLRSSIATMKETISQIYRERSLAGIEPKIVPVAEVFRLQRADELKQAEKRYLPQSSTINR
ncbi:MAG TPA: phosphoenolpyruvate mutase, partial [Chloroflexota bacterium]|nr:phosphoenolpyruvate mutase [Chloroflexota bacterium]